MAKSKSENNIQETETVNLRKVISLLLGIPKSLQNAKSAYLYLACPRIDCLCNDNFTNLDILQSDKSCNALGISISLVKPSSFPL